MTPVHSFLVIPSVATQLGVSKLCLIILQSQIIKIRISHTQKDIIEIGTAMMKDSIEVPQKIKKVELS